MSIFVIVHGGFGGGWEWTPVAQLLRERGHSVFTPTLTGMGERSHLGPRVGLSTHIEDIVAVLEFEDLHNVVLCGASYGGMPITGAVDRASERIALLVYIDRRCRWTASPAWTCCPNASARSCEPPPIGTGTAGSRSPTVLCPLKVSESTRPWRVTSRGSAISQWPRSPNRSV